MAPILRCLRAELYAPKHVELLPSARPGSNRCGGIIVEGAKHVRAVVRTRGRCNQLARRSGAHVVPLVQRPLANLQLHRQPLSRVLDSISVVEDIVWHVEPVRCDRSRQHWPCEASLTVPNRSTFKLKCVQYAVLYAETGRSDAIPPHFAYPSERLYGLVIFHDADREIEPRLHHFLELLDVDDYRGGSHGVSLPTKPGNELVDNFGLPPRHHVAKVESSRGAGRCQVGQRPKKDVVSLGNVNVLFDYPLHELRML
mmetsp:Transcript_8052/g.19324  ORF Transcript_8052/g.19324 Transcript_8052/m.19324 type:complete len:256 (-) Transcript_8052:564-1331(-)